MFLWVILVIDKIFILFFSFTWICFRCLIVELFVSSFSTKRGIIGLTKLLLKKSIPLKYRYIYFWHFEDLYKAPAYFLKMYCTSGFFYLKFSSENIYRKNDSFYQS